MCVCVRHTVCACVRACECASACVRVRASVTVRRPCVLVGVRGWPGWVTGWLADWVALGGWVTGRLGGMVALALAGWLVVLARLGGPTYPTDRLTD